MTMFLTKWQANKQQGRGWAPARLDLFKLDVWSRFQSIKDVVPGIFSKQIQATYDGNWSFPWVKNIAMAIPNPGGDKPPFGRGENIASQFTTHPLFRGASKKKTP